MDCACFGFEAKHIIDHWLVQLEPSNSASGFRLARGPDGETILSAKVQCLVAQNNEIRVYGGLGALADSDGLVRVVFGNERPREPFEEIPFHCTHWRTMNYMRGWWSGRAYRVVPAPAIQGSSAMMTAVWAASLTTRHIMPRRGT